MVFLVDISKSIGHDYLLKMKQLLLNVVLNVNIGPDYNLMSVVKFAEHPHALFALNDRTTKASLVEAINNIPVIPKFGTNIGKALKFVDEHIFIPSAGDRPDALNVLVVISDGKSHENSSGIHEQAMVLKHRNVKIVTFGVGENDISRTTLNAISSSRRSHFFNDVDGPAINRMTEIVLERVCKISK